MTRTNRALVAALFLAVNGCTTSPNVSTTSSPEGSATDGSARVGLHYFLPRGEIRLTGSCDKSDCEGTFKIAVSRVIEAEPGKRYFLIYKPNAFYDDDFTLETDDAGLLKTVTSSTTDQLPAIVEAVTDTIVNLVKSGAEFGAESATTGKLAPFVYTFDPLTESGAAKTFMSGLGIHFDCHVQAISESKDVAHIARAASGTTADQGVFYHPPISVTLTFSTGTSIHDSAVSVLPDYRVTECLSLRRAALVKQETRLTFSSGMVNHVQVSRPSQVLAAVQIPQKIAKQAADAIPAIFKIQSEAATRDLKDQTAVLQAQRDYLQAQIDLRKKESELEMLRRSRSGATPTPTPSSQ